MEFNDESFRVAVIQEVKGEAPDEIKKFLRDPSNLIRWRDMLASITADVQTQHTEKNAAFQVAKSEIMENASKSLKERRALVAKSQQELKTWSASAQRFRLSINDRLREAKRLINESYQRGFKERRALESGGDALADALEYLIEHHLQGDEAGIAYAEAAIQTWESA